MKNGWTAGLQRVILNGTKSTWDQSLAVYMRHQKWAKNIERLHYWPGWWTEETYFKFANNTKLEISINTTDGCAVIQRHLYRLEKRTNMTLMGSLAVTAREGENPYAVGQAAGQAAGKQLGRTGLKGLGGHQVDQWQQRPTACWATSGRVLTGGWRESQLWWGHSWSTVHSRSTVPGSTVQGRQKHAEAILPKASLKLWRDWTISHLEKGRASWNYLAWKIEGLSICLSTWH